MKRILRVAFSIIALAIGGTSTATAQGTRGTGDNFGSGWESDGRGGVRGTGDNFGKGWERR